MAKLGAVFYVLWGVLHLKASHAVYSLANSLEAGMVQGRLLQDASFMMMVSVLAIWVAVTRNWKNDRIGYRVNLVVVSAVDVFFILLIAMPGYLPMKIAAAGPVLWILALIFSTLAIRKAPAD
jgi:hypothetical protein